MNDARCNPLGLVTAAALALAAVACPSTTPNNKPGATCPGDTIVATRQAEVDALASCSSLASLSLQGTDISSLAALQGVVADGDGASLALLGTRVTDLTPLGSLVVDELVLDDNRRLTSLSGLQLAANAKAIDLVTTGPLEDVVALGVVEEVDRLGLGSVPDGVAAGLSSLARAGDVWVSPRALIAFTLPTLAEVGQFLDSYRA